MKKVAEKNKFLDSDTLNNKSNSLKKDIKSA